MKKQRTKTKKTKNTREKKHMNTAGKFKDLIFQNNSRSIQKNKQKSWPPIYYNQFIEILWYFQYILHSSAAHNWKYSSESGFNVINISV